MFSIFNQGSFVISQNTLIDAHLDKFAEFSIAEHFKLIRTKVFYELCEAMSSSRNSLACVSKISLLSLLSAQVQERVDSWQLAVLSTIGLFLDRLRDVLLLLCMTVCVLTKAALLIQS